jgi:hypothetical protein
MPGYFEIKNLKNGYKWHDMFANQRGYNYAVDVLRIPSEDIEAIICDPDNRRLGIFIKEDARLNGGDNWFYRLVQTHMYIRTEPDLVTLY